MAAAALVGAVGAACWYTRRPNILTVIADGPGVTWPKGRTR